MPAVQHHPDLAGHSLLGFGDKGLQCGLQRREPQAVINQFGPAPVGGPLEPAEFAFQRHMLEFGMGGDEHHRAGRLVDLPALDADQTVLNDVKTTHTLGTRAPVQFDDRFEHGDRLAVDGYWPAGLEADDHLVGSVPVQRRVFGVVVDVLGGRVPEMLQEAGFHGATPHVLIDGERRALGDIDRDRVLLGERNGLLPGPGVVPDRRQHVEIRCQRGESNLESHLVVALTGAAVSDDAPVVLPCGGHQVFDDQRSAQCRHQRVAIHVERVGLDGGQAVLLGELVAGIDHDGLNGPAVDGPLAHDLHILAALPEVDGDRHHLFAGLPPNPADGHRGVQAAGVGQDDALGHEVSPLGRCLTKV